MPELLVVATPIGNLNDLSPRVEEALKSCDLIAAEDTRVTQKLLNHFGLHKPSLSCHRHNEEQKADGIIEKMLAENLTVCLTCDAGTPAISDPGHQLVAAAWDAGIQVTPVCGPSAVTACLSASGFDAREFAFYGFLPREKKPLREKLASILETGIPVAVLYESPYRVVELVEIIAKELPGSRLAVCCDVSKKYEKIVRGDAGQVAQELAANPNVEKGEYCVVCDLSAVPRREKKPDAPDAEAIILKRLLEGDEFREACAFAMDSGCTRNDVYRAKIRIQDFLEI